MGNLVSAETVEPCESDGVEKWAVRPCRGLKSLSYSALGHRLLMAMP